MADHDYAVISVTGTGSTALFQLYNPWGTYEPPAITWAQLTQGGDFSQDGDTIVSSAAATGLPSGQPTDTLASVDLAFDGLFASNGTNLASAIGPPRSPALSLTSGFSPQSAGAWDLTSAFPAPAGGDYLASSAGGAGGLASAFPTPASGDSLASSAGEIATPGRKDTPYRVGELARETSGGPSTGAKLDAGLDSQFWATFEAGLGSRFWAST